MFRLSIILLMLDGSISPEYAFAGMLQGRFKRVGVGQLVFVRSMCIWRHTCDFRMFVVRIVRGPENWGVGTSKYCLQWVWTSKTN